MQVGRKFALTQLNIGRCHSDVLHQIDSVFEDNMAVRGGCPGIPKYPAANTAFEGVLLLKRLHHVQIEHSRIHFGAIFVFLCLAGLVRGLVITFGGICFPSGFGPDT